MLGGKWRLAARFDSLGFGGDMACAGTGSKTACVCFIMFSFGF